MTNKTKKLYELLINVLVSQLTKVCSEYREINKKEAEILLCNIGLYLMEKNNDIRLK